MNTYQKLVEYEHDDFRVNVSVSSDCPPETLSALSGMMEHLFRHIDQGSAVHQEIVPAPNRVKQAIPYIIILIITVASVVWFGLNSPILLDDGYAPAPGLPGMTRFVDDEADEICWVFVSRFGQTQWCEPIENTGY